MVEMCDLILEHASDLDRCDSEPLVQAAAERWIEVLGEAASKVSAAVTSAHPEIPWRSIVGTRVILAHAYFNIDVAVVRRVITSDVPTLRRALESVLADLPADA